jgi:hypothetical protein
MAGVAAKQYFTLGKIDVKLVCDTDDIAAFLDGVKEVKKGDIVVVSFKSTHQKNDKDTYKEALPQKRTYWITQKQNPTAYNATHQFLLTVVRPCRGEGQ